MYIYIYIYILELDCTYSCSELFRVVTACWLRGYCRLDPRGSTQTIKSRPQIDSNMNENSTQHRHNTSPKNQPTSTPTLIQNRSKLGPKSTHSQPQVNPNWIQDRFRRRPRHQHLCWTNFAPELGPTWGRFGKLGSGWGPGWPKYRFCGGLGGR